MIQYCGERKRTDSVKIRRREKARPCYRRNIVEFVEEDYENTIKVYVSDDYNLKWQHSEGNHTGGLSPKFALTHTYATQD
jgi:hypothetical protein